jgi:hypothetical protein
METPGVTLTDDEVRERFSAYHDGELPDVEAAFVRKRLDEDAALRAEYEQFVVVLQRLAGLGTDARAEMKPGVPDLEKVDLLRGIQHRLNRRSGGKFYRSRWSRVAGVVPLEALAVALLVLMLIAYVCLTFISGLRPAEPRETPSHSSAPQH